MNAAFAACRRPVDRLSLAERVDPAGHAMHVAAMLAWAVAGAVSNAAEGITWGILAAVCVARLPKTWRALLPVLRDPLWLSLVAWAAWLAIATAASPVADGGSRSFLPARWIFTPLLLWPMMGRPWLVLGAVGAGAALQMAICLGLSWGSGGIQTNAELNAFSSFGQLQWQVHLAVAVGAGMLRWMPSPSRWLAVPALIAGLVVAERSGRRLTAVMSLVGLGIVALRPLPRRHRLALAVAAALLCVGAALIAGSAVRDRVAGEWWQVKRQWVRNAPYAAVSIATGSRLPLAHAAWDLGWRSPLLGNGKGSMKRLLPTWAKSQARRHPRRAPGLQELALGELNDAHNAVLNAFCDGGFPGAAFLGTALIGLGWRLWRLSRAIPAAGVTLALYSAILLGMFCQPVTAKAPGMIIAVCLALSCRFRDPD